MIPDTPAGPRLLGAALAGGRSRRFGTDKALALLAGRPLVAHAVESLAPHVDRAVVVGEDRTESSLDRVDVIPDETPGLGPLGGLATALALATEADFEGVFILACDTPLVPSGLLGELIRLWDGHSVVLPESGGPLGIEPLCGVYPVGVVPAVAEAAKDEDRSMAALVHSLPVRRLPLSRVRTYGDPVDLFLNVNRPQDLERARALLAVQKGRAHAR